MKRFEGLEDMKNFLDMIRQHGPHSGKLLLANAVVPKGSEYYISVNGGEFISSALRIEKIHSIF